MLVAALATSADARDASTLVAVTVPTDAASARDDTEPQAAPLAEGDRLELLIGAWNNVEGRFEIWDGVGGEVPIARDGSIHVPLAGRIRAADRAPEEIASNIALELQDDTGLAAPPSVTVRLAGRPPVYVAGDVMNPGEFEYRDGLTVQQALSLAGGPIRIPPDRIDSLFGQRVRLEEEALRIGLGIARLEAELAGDPEIDLPEDMPDNAALQELLEVERQLLSSRRAAIAAQVASVATLIEVLGEVRAGILQQQELLSGDVDRAEADLARREELLSRGLARANDVESAQTRLSALQLRQVDMNMQLINLEKDLSEARRAREAFGQNREIAILEELSAMRDRLRDTELSLAQVETDLAGTTSADPRYEPSIVSRESGPETPATLLTRLRPGDTIVLRAIEEEGSTR